MARLALVRLGIQATLKAEIADPLLNVYKNLQMSPDTPCMMPSPEFTEYIETMDGESSMMWRLWVLLNAGDMDDSQDRLDQYLDTEGDRSIFRALNTNAARLHYLGNPTCAWSQVTRFSRMPADLQGPNFIDWGGTVYWGCALDLRVWLDSPS